MKRPISLFLAFVFVVPIAPAAAQLPGQGSGHGPGGQRGRGGLPAEVRDSIHGLFDGHETIKRELTTTETGYRSTTTSTDPAVATLLQKHVKQMEDRLKSGLMVRRWDPAYVEFGDHYEDIEIQITNIADGISVVATGKTEDARKVARNHASIISKFVENGWDEHHKTHPAVLAGPATAPPVSDAALGDTGPVHQVGDLLVAAQPSADDFKLAKERGIRSVVNIRHADEIGFDEAQVVRQLGMTYIHHPWNGEEELTDEKFDAIRASLHTAARPVLLHCGSANRAAGVWLAWRVLDQGVAWETALEEAKEIGLGSTAYENRARTYIEKRQSAPSLSDPQRAACLQLGDDASSALMENLVSQLKGALAAGGPIAAITVCATVAHPTTDAASQQFPGVVVGRTSLQPRNAARNAPDATDRMILEQWDQMAEHQEDIGPLVIPIHENAARYYRPIFVQDACLTCHGSAESIGDSLRESLSQSYPNDQATGYQSGDLRGAFRVEIDLEKALGSTVPTER